MRRKLTKLIIIFSFLLLIVSCIPLIPRITGEIYGKITPYDGYVVSSSESIPYGSADVSYEQANEHVVGEYIIKLDVDHNMSEMKAALEAEAWYESLSVKSTLSTADGSLKYMLIESKLSPEDLKEKLKAYPWIINIERNGICKPLEMISPEIASTIAPNDTYYNLQWHYAAINLPQAWNTTKGSVDVVVAVLDTGVRFDHPDLNSIFLNGYDFIDNDGNPSDPGDPGAPSEWSHGTHVTGTIAAFTNNSLGVAGVTWGGLSNIKVLPVRVLGPSGGSNFQVAQGIIYAVEHGAKVINMSLGGSSPSTVMEDACDYAYYNDTIIVASAGNDNSSLLYPAQYSTTFAIGAVRYDLTRSYYSNFGPALDFVAPGGDLTVDQNGDGYSDGVLSTSWSIDDNYAHPYVFLHGTSMAAPHVTGVIALMISNGIVGVETIRSILRNTATDLGSVGFDNYYGYGLIDAYEAVTYYNNWEPLIVFSTNKKGNLDNYSLVNDDGSYVLPVTYSESYVFAWQDFDHDGDLSYGDLYGYYGYSGGDPDEGLALAVYVSDGGQSLANFTFGVLINENYKPSAKEIKPMLEYKRGLIEAHYDKLH
ncbi:hypothetical protein AT15_05485 [Kosmotoga arenicorallina S304]|uniref:Peptidase S8/S53 domain-containing protein n=1 Tax=Kosmotoga arenicorallina S304 TaxID=1453497 RepID=A0A176K3D5_9BACT|nr:S8 family peptidase [Kosmotoga arenicorallina]OAA31526.1 hypothetical protein AT15_05485 [Kosmotoga arenicorallina S304]